MFTNERFSVGKSRQSFTHTHTRLYTPEYKKTQRSKTVACTYMYTTYNIPTTHNIYDSQRLSRPPRAARSRQSRRIRIPSPSHYNNKRTIGCCCFPTTVYTCVCVCIRYIYEEYCDNYTHTNIL